MGTKMIVITALLVIVACFLPWWVLMSVAIPSTGDKSYSLFLSNPFYGDFQVYLYMYTAGSSVIDIVFIHGSFLDINVPASAFLLVAIIIALAGGVLGVLSTGKKKVALISSILVILGPVLYLIFILIGTLPGGVNASYFESQGLNPLFGTFDRSVFTTNFNHYFGAIGCILTLILGVILLIGSFSGKE